MDFSKWDSVSGWREHFLVMPVGDACFLADVVGKDVTNIVAKTVPGFPNKCPLPNVSRLRCQYIICKLYSVHGTLL